LYPGGRAADRLGRRRGPEGRAVAAGGGRRLTGRRRPCPPWRPAGGAT